MKPRSQSGLSVDLSYGQLGRGRCQVDIIHWIKKKSLRVKGELVRGNNNRTSVGLE